jgi:hypothetical protein
VGCCADAFGIGSGEFDVSFAGGHVVDLEIGAAFVD